MTTLLLNLDMKPLSWVPLSVINWQDAVSGIVSNKVTVLEHHDNWFIHSPSVTIQVPSVIALTKYVNLYDFGMRFTRWGLFIRDNFTCLYCNNKFPGRDLTVDHVVPKSHGGKKTWQNLVSSCGPCNRNKGNDHTILPLRPPFKPSIADINRSAMNIRIGVKYKEWIPYLSDGKVFYDPDAKAHIYRKKMVQTMLAN